MSNKVVPYLMDHKQAMLETYNRFDGSPTKSWKHLVAELPGIEEVMKFNTFKQYYAPFVLVVKEYEERENHIAGWSIAKSKDGYYRGNRRLHGKLYSVYLGKEYDREAFTEKIKRKEQSLEVFSQPRATVVQERPLLIR